MFKSLSITFVLLAFMLVVSGQNKAVQFIELKELQLSEPKPVVVLLMTDWCKFCHAMEHTMLKNPKVSNLLDQKYRTVLFNAEVKQDIFFAGRTLRYRSGLNELAQELAPNKGVVSYPTICILNSKNEIIYKHEGYLSAQALLYTLEKIGKLSN